MSFCPKCGYPQVCPCPACTKRRKDKKTKPWKWALNKNTIICANCGLAKGEDWWENLDMECYKEEIKESIEKEKRRQNERKG